MKLSTIQRKINRVRNKIKKVSKNDRFRLSVSRSIKNISAQIIDDNKNITLLSASSNEKDIKSLKKINKTSHTARTGPPAIIPVPFGADLNLILPAPSLP